MSVYKRGTKWHYAFCIRKVRYRGALPEVRTKFQAEQAETKIKLSVFEARYGKQTGDKDLIEFIDEIYLPWARQNSGLGSTINFGRAQSQIGLRERSSRKFRRF